MPPETTKSSTYTYMDFRWPCWGWEYGAELRLQQSHQDGACAHDSSGDDQGDPTMVSFLPEPWRGTQMHVVRKIIHLKSS